MLRLSRFRLAVAALLGVLALLMGLSSKPSEARQAALGTLAPLRFAFQWVSAVPGWFRDGDSEESRLRMADAQAAVARLTEENLHLRESLRQVAQFRDKLPIESAGAVVCARVFGKDPSVWTRARWIDRGSADGIRKGNAVLAGAILVGRVADVSAHAARVQLLSDPDSAAWVRVLPKDLLIGPPGGGAPQAPPPPETGRHGALRGAGDSGYALTLAWIPNSEPIQPEEWAVTTGRDGKFAPNLIVGQVVKASHGESFQDVRVRSPIDLDTLSTVLVVAGAQ